MIETKLLGCMQAVFPALSAAAAAQATLENTAAWDSLATVTLVAVIEEDFGIEVAPVDLTHFQSFAAIADYLRRRGADAGAAEARGR